MENPGLLTGVGLQQNALFFRGDGIAVDAQKANQIAGFGNQIVVGRDLSIHDVTEPIHVENFFRREPLAAVVADEVILTAHVAMEGTDGAVQNALLQDLRQISHTFR